MKIAELFVNLGLKGADQAGKALGGVKSGLGDVKSLSLEAKAAIVGVVYGLEKLMSNSAQAGTGLYNFNALTGMSTKELQQWQYAARQVGISGEEMTGNLKGVQSVMSNMLLGKGAPEGLAMVANKVGLDPKKMRDTMYVMQQLQKFAQQVPQDVGNQMLKSFGLSEGAIAAMRRNAFRPEVFSKAPTYGEGEIKSLDKVNVAWSNLGQKIEMAFGHLTAKDGLKIVGEISKMTTEVLKLVDALAKLADKLQIFKGIGKIFEGWSMILNGVTDTVDKVGKNKAGPAEGGKEALKNMFEGLAEAAHGAFLTAKDALDTPSPADVAAQRSLAPPVQGAPSSKTQNINVNQNLNFQHDGKDAKKTGQSVHKAVKDAYRQLPAQGQAS